MIFTYWHGDPAPISGFLDHWRASFPDFRVFSDDDVRPLLEQRGGPDLAIYGDIRMPACRSDLARLLLLYEHGGVYLDAHVGLRDSLLFAALIEKLSTFDLILFDKTWEHKGPGDIYLINTVMLARRRSELVSLLIESAVKNLAAHHAAERQAVGYVPYNIYVLTGAWDIRRNLLDQTTLSVREDFRRKVHVEPIVQGQWALQLYQFYGYRKPGQHWSERQKQEPLFSAGTR